MTERQQPFTSMFNSMGGALDHTFSMLENLRKGKLSRAELRDWYDTQRKAVQEPLSTAYEAGSDYLGRIMPAQGGRRATGQRRRRALRSSRSMKRGRKAASQGIKTAARGVVAMAKSASDRADRKKSRRSSSRSRSRMH